MDFLYPHVFFAALQGLFLAVQIVLFLENRKARKASDAKKDSADAQVAVRVAVLNGVSLEKGRLLTYTQETYPGMPAMFGQLWDGDTLRARVYGDTRETIEVWQQIFAQRHDAAERIRIAEAAAEEARAKAGRTVEGF